MRLLVLALYFVRLDEFTRYSLARRILHAGRFPAPEDGGHEAVLGG